METKLKLLHFAFAYCIAPFLPKIKKAIRRRHPTPTPLPHSKLNERYFSLVCHRKFSIHLLLQLLLSACYKVCKYNLLVIDGFGMGC